MMRTGSTEGVAMATTSLLELELEQMSMISSWGRKRGCAGSVAGWMRDFREELSGENCVG